eukprot:GFYU01007898.1.p1 GENE.GFYU01007898.1~~GFYU01007898.1.p1  ORF type:complete len:110 (+),score=37.44 GFYU01007898.1:28-330(+)
MGKEEPYTSVPFFWTVQYGISTRYAGNAMKWDEIIINGDLTGRSFMAFFIQGSDAVAVFTMGQDPAAVACAELLRLGKMPKAKELKNITKEDLVKVMEEA